jgi:predicted DNA-binding protein (MmcQ/YjbR family)
MDIEQIREYCLSREKATEGFPFDEETLVFKVMGKIFALLSLEANGSLNLKCDPDRATGLREAYPAIRPGYHMNKRHWNTISLDGSISRELITEMIDHSYELVVRGLSGKLKKQLKGAGR